jgi:carboxyl-terminal processing protease
MKRIACYLSFIAWVLIAICLTSYALPETGAQPLNFGTNAAINLRIFDQVWTKINENYFDPTFNGVDWLKMRKIYRPQAEQAKNIDALLTVIKQMMAVLKTSHLEVRAVPTVKEKEFEQKMGSYKKGEIGKFGNGLGWMVSEGQYVITGVNPGSPAERAGVKPGWILTAVNDEPPSFDKALELAWRNEGKPAAYRFRDQQDAEVNLSFGLEWYAAAPDLPIARRMLDANIGYLGIHSFAPGVGNWVKKAMIDFQQTKAKTLIIDLRGNGGGLITETTNCLSYFFKEDVGFGTFVERKGRSNEIKIKGLGQNAFAGEVVVLTEFTGSAAEMFCAAIREYGRGKIIGVKTLGKVLASRRFYLPNNIELLVAVRDYRTPKGARLEGSGIVPDVEIGGWTIEDIRTGRDRVLEKARELLSKQEIDRTQTL